MMRFAALARKLHNHVVRRVGCSSTSGEPGPGAMGRAAPGDAKLRANSGRVAPVPASQESLPGSFGRAAPGQLKVPAESRARSGGKVTRMPPSQESGSRAASMRLPPPTWKAVEGKYKVKIGASSSEAFNTKMARDAAVRATKSRYLADGLSASTASAPSTSRTSPPRPPHTESDFWFNVMMAGGATVAIVVHVLKGFVEKKIESKMKQKDAEEKKLIKEKEELDHKQELEIAIKGQIRRGWFWQ